jgi:hypothetical protein
MLRSSFSAFETACPSLTCGFPFGIANCILCFANGNIENLLGKLRGIARTFGHEASMPQISGYFETETLPEV